MSRNSGGTLLTLKNDGDKAVLALCGAPHLRNVFYSDETKMYEPWDEAKANGAKKKTRYAMSVYVVTVNGTETDRMLVFEMSSAVMMEVIALRDKHGVGTCLFLVTRHGAKGDKDTTFEIQPDQPITPELRSICGSPDPSDRDGWISGTIPLADVEMELAEVNRRRRRKQRAPQQTADPLAAGAGMPPPTGSGAPVVNGGPQVHDKPGGSHERKARGTPSPGAETAKTAAKADSEDSASDADKPCALLDLITRTIHARYTATAPEKAITLLSACSAPMPPSICWTQYEGGTYDTLDGRPCSGGLHDLAQVLADYAQLVMRKGAGRYFIGARSKNGRCRDEDIDCIILITLDCDNRGEWHALRAVLDQAGIAYIVQRSASHAPPELIKWHITIALARPWAGEKPTWRVIWRFLVGMFAALGKLSVDFDFRDEKGVWRPNYGFDQATDRLGQPIFCSAKRSKERSAPETIHVPGNALDLDKLLAEGGFDVAWFEAAKKQEAKRDSARAASAARVASGVGLDPSSSLLAFAFGEAGMLGERIERTSASGYAVECPLELHHSGGDRFDTSTMIMDPYEPGGKGWFNCKHSCGDMEAERVLKLLPEDAVERAKQKWKDARRAARAEAKAAEKAARREAKAAHVAARETTHVPAGIVFLTGDETEMGLALLARLRADGTSLVHDDGRLHRYVPASGTWAAVHESEQSKIVQGFSGAPIEDSDKLVRVQAAGVAGAKRLAGDQARRDGFFAEGPAGIAFSHGFAVVTAKGVELQPLSPQMRARNAYDFPFTASAEPTRFLKFLDDVWRDDPDRPEKILLIQEFSGLSLIGRAPAFEQCIVTLGKTTPRPGEENGSNGKSTLGKILTRVFRPEWVAHIPPQLFSDEYRRAQLAGKRLNVVGELPEADIMESEAFKAIVTGDPINARPIYASPFDLTPQAGHLYNCNTLPGSNDLTFAFFRRFILLTFNRTFRPGDGTHVPDLDRVIVEAECAQIVSWCLGGAVRALSQGRYTIPASHEEELAEWKRTANQVSLYVSEACFPAKSLRPAPGPDGRPHDWTRASSLYSDYTTWCANTGHKAMAANKFGSRLKQAGHVPEKTETGSYYALTMRSTLTSSAERAREAEGELRARAAHVK